MTKEEYTDFISEISEILGLGKPVDILKLCATTDKFVRPLQGRIAELEKENAELKDELTKAKDLLLRFIELKNKPCASGHSVNMLLYENICADVEQFIKEIEK